jgi:hypothetical protein
LIDSSSFLLVFPVPLLASLEKDGTDKGGYLLLRNAVSRMRVWREEYDDVGSQLNRPVFADARTRFCSFLVDVENGSSKHDILSH